MHILPYRRASRCHANFCAFFRSLAILPRAHQPLTFAFRPRQRLIHSTRLSFKSQSPSLVMERQIDPPYQPQDPNEVRSMVAALEAAQGKKSGRGSFACRKNVYPVLGSDIQVASWKMSEWDYKKPNLPTYARGLFTYQNSRGNQEIAVRGYDKFFNHGETRKTEWRNVENNTRGPYELSLKENGCIIFMAALEDGTLLVCSKHSTGSRYDTEHSHASVGENWVEKHLATVGKTKQDFARALRERNVTAVAELCDDSFEEHVLAYRPEDAGLYLHGVNLNLPSFVTYPAGLVDRFAEEWGFKKTMHLVLDGIPSVKQFLDESAETGSYAGKPTEGFVIRCQARDGPEDPWTDWFFKYKFEEPYLMYRQWRECTKALIGNKPPKVNKHNKITWLYLEYVKKRLERDSSLGPAYLQNHGIIQLRNDFLEQAGLTGEDVIKQADEELKQDVQGQRKNIVLVPVATIGCGKTTVALALVKLFDWGHVQNDNIAGKQRPPRFAKAICDELKSHAVVIADRNNHQKAERGQLMGDVLRDSPDTRFIALHYRHKDGKDTAIQQKTRERVFSRGDNHQTIQAGTKGRDFIIEIMDGFMKRSQPLDPERAPDNGFDQIIELDATLESRQNLDTVVSELERYYPDLFDGKLPTKEDLDEAMNHALTDYKPVIKHDLSQSNTRNNANNINNGKKGNQKPKQLVNGSSGQSQKKPKSSKIEYFGVAVPTARVLSVLEQNFSRADSETAKFYRKLQETRRIQPEFHVTLIHRSGEKQHEQYWSLLCALAEKVGGAGQASLGQVQVQLDRILWDDRLMAIKVVLIPVPPETTGDQQQQQQSPPLVFKSVNAVAHITVGTADASIKPRESNDMLERWWNDRGQDIRESIVEPHTVVNGHVRAVLQRRS